MSAPAAREAHFRTLSRLFSRQYLENELTSAQGNPLETVTQLLALFGAASFCLSFILVMKYFFALSQASWDRRVAAAWSDREFLISLGMAIASFVTVLGWDSLFPSRRDCVVLGSLPVRLRTMFAAKVSSILVLLGAAVVAANGFTTMAFPLAVLGDRATLTILARYTLVHFLVISGATLFAFLSLMAFAALLINVFPHRLFQRISVWVQLAILVVILSLFFMMPNIAHPELLAKPENMRLAVWLPPFWFVGLYQQLLGGGFAAAVPLAQRAGWGLAAAAVVASLLYSVGYRRHVRRVLETEALPPGKAGLRADLPGWIARLWRDPVEQAVFGFVSKTMLRNRKHRVLLALYCTVGLAYVFEGLVALFETGGAGQWHRPSVQTTAVPLIFSFFLLLGMRMLFTLPVDLKANWIFRLTEGNRPERYLAGVRKVMLVYGVAPVALLPLPLYGALWGWQTAARHLFLVLLIQWIIVERLLLGFKKIPFTCSFLPGKANLKATFGAYFLLYTTLSSLVVSLETWLLSQPLEFYLVATVVASAWLVRLVNLRRRQEREIGGFLYEESPNWALATLDLRQ